MVGARRPQCCSAARRLDGLAGYSWDHGLPGHCTLVGGHRRCAPVLRWKCRVLFARHLVRMVGDGRRSLGQLAPGAGSPCAGAAGPADSDAPVWHVPGPGVDCHAGGWPDEFDRRPRYADCPARTASASFQRVNRNVVGLARGGATRSDTARCRNQYCTPMDCVHRHAGIVGRQCRDGPPPHIGTSRNRRWRKRRRRSRFN